MSRANSSRSEVAFVFYCEISLAARWLDKSHEKRRATLPRERKIERENGATPGDKGLCRRAANLFALVKREETHLIGLN